MIFIEKSPAPPKLETLRKQAEAQNLSDKEGYAKLENPLKDQVKEALMREQGHLCAYCMRILPDERIKPEDTDLKDVYIEHWQARSAENHTGINMGLYYGNMLAVCSGDEKAPDAVGRRKKRCLTCDKKRENAKLKINPLDAATLELVYYTEDGQICSNDPDIDKDLNVHLNLNCCVDAVLLPKNRKAVLDEVQKNLAEQEGDYLQNCIEQLHMWEGETDPKTPYIGIAIWWLKDQINSLLGGINSNRPVLLTVV